MTKEFRFDPQQGRKNFFFSTASRRALVPNQCASQSVSGALRTQSKAIGA